MIPMELLDEVDGCRVLMKLEHMYICRIESRLRKLKCAVICVHNF